MTTPLDPAELLRKLAGAGFDYVLIGGLAVIAHGVIRSTEDVDICPNPETASAFGIEIKVCSLSALRLMKRAAGRPRDLQDLTDLGTAHPEAG